MKQGEQYSLWNLISSGSNAQRILIPQIQRDYIQHREGRVADNLERFVSVLVKALIEKTAINLSFIYGNVIPVAEKNSADIADAFNPIDGQQRLTTLYLLHYYVFNEAGSAPCKNLLRGKLLYRTRKTTGKFLDDLFDNNHTTFHGKDSKKPSVSIRESGWYSSLWENDSSVLSCLKVLDQFKIEFDRYGEISWTDITDRLTCANGTTCPITFMKLELEGLDKPNELYIKMNSRGKQLTAFENFKSELYGFLKEHAKANPDFLPNFKANMDGDWLDFVWNLCNVGETDQEKTVHAEKHSDSLYRNILHVCFLNSIIARNEIAPFKISLEDHASRYYLQSYKDLIEGDKLLDIIEDFYYTMELLWNLKEKLNPDTYSDITKRIFVDYSKQSGFITHLEENVSYPTRTLLYAIMHFARSFFEAEGDKSDLPGRFQTWWRIIKNLIANSRIDEYDNFVSAIKEISRFGRAKDIGAYLIGLGDTEEFLKLPVLNSSQLHEEIVKQKIIHNQGAGWEKAILEAEKNPYFCGEIYFALRFSGVERADDATDETLTAFRKSWKAIQNIFQEDDRTLLHRALLTYGDYSLVFSGTRESGNYLINYYSSYEKNHNLDWRGMLRDNQTGFTCFKKLLEDFGKTKQSFEEFANERIEQYPETLNPDAEELRCYLIKDKSFFDYMENSCRCWFKNGEYRLLKTKNRSTYINFKLYKVVSELGFKKIELHPGEGERKENAIIYKNVSYTFKNNVLCTSDGKEQYASVSDMIKNLKSM